MKIAMLNHKGGSGKTTSAVMLAYALGAAGRQVGIKDLDPQKSATKWLKVAPGKGVELFQEGKKYDVVIIDTTPDPNDPKTTDAVMEANRVIIVCEINPLEVWGAQSAAKFVKEVRPKLRPAILVSRFEGHTEYGKSREAFVAEMGVRALSHVIPRRVCFKKATTRGYAAVPGAERANLAGLAIEILTLTP